MIMMITMHSRFNLPSVYNINDAIFISPTTCVHVHADAATDMSQCMHSRASVMRSNHLKALNERQESIGVDSYIVGRTRAQITLISYDANFSEKRPLESNVSHMMAPYSQYTCAYIHAWSQLHSTNLYIPSSHPLTCILRHLCIVQYT